MIILLNQDDKFERFAAVINKNARAQCKKIEKQTADFKKKQLKEIEDAAKKELDAKFKFESGRIAAQINAAISGLQNDSKRLAAQKREEIRQKVFLKAKEKLTQFTETAQYESFIENSLKNLVNSIDGDIIIKARKKDIDLVSRFAKKYPAVVSVAQSDKIEIGGITAMKKDETVFIDDTLGSRLDAQKDFFRAQSGLDFEF